eukprot:scaffold10833_cov114-Skeletonema_marinoi.AAC.4
MALKIKRSRSTKSASNAVKPNVFEVADKNVTSEQEELRDEQISAVVVVVEDSRREGTEDLAPYSLGNLFNCWGGMEGAPADDSVEVKIEDGPENKQVSTAQSKEAAQKDTSKAAQEEAKKEDRKVGRKQAQSKKAAKKEAKKAAKEEAKKAKAAQKQAAKAAKLAAEEEASVVLLNKNDHPDVKKDKTQDESSLGIILKPDEPSIDKLLKQLKADQKKLIEVEKKRTKVEEKMLATIRLIKGAAMDNTDLDSILYENDDLRDILSLDGTASASETSSFIRAEDEREILSVIADGCLCMDANASPH